MKSKAAFSALTCFLFLNCSSPGLAGQPLPPPDSDNSGVDRVQPVTPDIETLLNRCRSLDSLSGLVRLKIHSPKLDKKFKAALVLSGDGSLRIDGLSPFGSPVFYLVHVKNNLLIHLPSAGKLYMDFMKREEFFDHLGFPRTGYNLLELVSGCFLSSRLSGEVILKEVDHGREFLVSVKPENQVESYEVLLDQALLPKQVDIVEGGLTRGTITYASYKLLDGFKFPYHSVFQVPAEDAVIEFIFKRLNANKKITGKNFRVPVKADQSFSGNGKLIQGLPFAK